MAFSRYTRDSVGFDGRGLTLATALVRLRRAIKDGLIFPSRSIVVTQTDRLDTIAASVYGDGRYWWVLAVASDIGWGLQAPPGTIINILDLKEVERLVG